MTEARRLGLGRTLRRGLRAWWDYLGLACALSAIWTVVVAVPIGLALQFAAVAGGAGLSVGAACAVVITAWITAGIHRVAFQAIQSDEPGLVWLIRFDGGLVRQAIALTVVQLVVTAGLGLNVAFYLGLRSPVGLALAIVFAYGLVLWMTVCLFQWPLFTAGAMGFIKRHDGTRPRLMSVFRNAMILMLSAPMYGLGLWAFLVVFGLPIALTGVGLVLIVPGLAAFVTCQAVRDHMVRCGMLPPPDEGGPVPDVWTVKGNDERGKERAP